MIQDGITHPPNKAKFSLISTLENAMVPDAHTFQDLTEVLQEDSADTLVTSTDLMLAFPFAVQVNKVRDLRITSSTKIITKIQKGDCT